MTPQAVPHAGSILDELRGAIAAAGANGAAYPWIAGVLAGCLAAEATPAEACAAAIDTLRLVAVSPVRQ